MIVFHGSNQRVENPDVKHSLRNLYFGSGFYVTTIKEQAEKWAKRRADLVTGSPIINSYELSLDKTDFNVKDFGEDLDSWFDFVCNCREGKKDYLQFDIIIGKVANDKVFRVVDMYHQGIWDKERAIKEIRVYPDYDQIAFISQRSIDELLEFVLAEELTP